MQYRRPHGKPAPQHQQRRTASLKPSHLPPLRSYRRLALKYHPDVDATDEAAAEFSLVGEAYDVLSQRECPQAAAC